MSKCVRCKKEYLMKDAPRGSVLVELKALNIGARARDVESRDKQCDILRRYGDGIKLCPECGRKFLKWMENPQSMYVEDYEEQIEELQKENRELKKCLTAETEAWMDVCDERNDLLRVEREKSSEIEALKEALHDLECEKHELLEEFECCMDQLHATEDMLAEANEYTIDRFKIDIMDELRNVEPEAIKKFVVETVERAFTPKPEHPEEIKCDPHLDKRPNRHKGECRHRRNS